MGTILQTWFPDARKRLIGVYGMRFTMVFHLQVASTPFHMGLACLNFQYGAFDKSVTWKRGSETFSSTNIPHVRLDLATQTMACLKVPFLSQAEFFPVSQDSPTIGFLSVSNLTQANLGTGLTAPTMKLMVHLEDLEFFGATPQAVDVVTLQSAMNKEFFNEAYPMSSAVGAASASVGFIGKAVPSLSFVAGKASWAMGVAAGVLRYFGFSKPLVQEPTMRMIPMQNVCENNTDVATSAIMLGPMASNRCVIDNTVGGSDVDQMSLAYVLAQPCQIATFNIDNTDAAGTLLFGNLVSPSAMNFRVGKFTHAVPYYTDQTHNCVMPSGLSYFGAMFRLWRGSITYRFTFVKTPYHGGRVLITFVPQVLGVSTESATIEIPERGSGPPQPFGVSAIVDLKDKNVVDFKVPFAGPFPYLPYMVATGSLSVSVVDPLIFPSTVANSIGVLVEVFSDDMQFATPCGPRFAPMTSGGTVSLQSGLSNAFGDAIDEVTIGERMTSLKQLIQLPKWTMIPALVAGQPATILPWYYQPTQFASVPPKRPYPESFGYPGCIACCYSFVRGSTDIHIYAPDSGKYLTVEVSPGDWNQRPLTAETAGTWLEVPPSSANRVLSSAPNAIHVRLPNHGQTSRFDPGVLNACLSTAWYLRDRGSGPSTATRDPNVSNYSSYYTMPPISYARMVYRAPDESVTATTNVVVSRSAGDDAYASMYIGPPMVLVPLQEETVYDPDWPKRVVNPVRSVQQAPRATADILIVEKGPALEPTPQPFPGPHTSLIATRPPSSGGRPSTPMRRSVDQT
jgi:hypothetical protein